MTEYLKSRWVLILVLVLFILFKVPHLLLPFYWDECWPYVPAIKEMYHHGISLLPNAIDPNLSRGHPLFYHAIGAMWLRLFGTSNFSMHCFGLCISILFLITIFEAGYRIFNKRVAIMSLLLVATHISFFVQSSFVLFEVLVAFLCFLSIYLYSREKYFLATLSLSALFLTKESGLIAGFVIGVDGLISLFNTRLELRQRIIKLLPVTIACIMIGGFFVLQKHILGWYVLPLYTDTILNKWPDIWYRFGTCVLNINFCEDYQHILFFTLFVMTIIMVLKNRTLKNVGALSILILFVIVYYTGSSRILMVHEKNVRETNLTLLVFIAFIGIFIYTVFSYGRQRFYETTTQRKFILLAGLFVIMFLLFSTFAYFIPRYQMPSIIAILFLLAVFLDMLTRQTYVQLYYPVMGVILVTAYFSFKTNDGWGDNQLGFTKGLKTQLAVVEFLERSNLYDMHIYTNSFLEYEHLVDPNTGFLRSDKKFNNVAMEIKPITDVIVVDNIEQIDLKTNLYKDNKNFHLVYTITYGDKWAEIYIKN